MKVFMKPFKKGSKGFKSLLGGLREVGVDAKGIRLVGSKYKNREDHLVINWGDSKCTNYPHMLNRPWAVACATDKVKTAKVLIDNKVPCLPTCFSLLVAKSYLGNTDGVVFCRSLVNASKGKGIVIAKSVEELVDCKLYTVGIVDEDRVEYRIHVFKGKVIHQQQKKKRNGWKENPNFSDLVRNVDSGWVFAIKDVEASEQTKDAAIRAVEALGLDFGGVDIVQTSDGKGYVIEVNTACGLHGTTITNYVNAVKEYIGG